MKTSWLFLSITVILSFALKSSATSTLGPSGETLDAAKIKKILDRGDVHSVEQFLPLLPPSYLSNFVLMRESESTQGATPLAPRVLLFGETAQTILTFNGSHLERGFQTVEMVEFNENTLQFEFRQIDFSSGKPRLSEVNPEACMRCHSAYASQGRPNWDSYFFWKNAYGHHHDYVVGNRPGDELYELKQFLAQRQNDGRYKHLLIPSERGTAPYSDRFQDLPSLKPNTRLTMLLARWNAKKLVGMMKHSAHYAAYRDLILLQQSDELAETGLLETALKLPEVALLFNKSNYQSASQRSASMLEIVSQQLGFKPADWSLQFEAKSFGTPSMYSSSFKTTYYDGILFEPDLVLNELWKDLAAHDPEVKGRYTQAPFEMPNDDKNYGAQFSELGGRVSDDTLRDRDTTALIFGHLRTDLTSMASDPFDLCDQLLRRRH